MFLPAPCLPAVPCLPSSFSSSFGSALCSPHLGVCGLGPGLPALPSCGDCGAFQRTE